MMSWTVFHLFSIEINGIVLVFFFYGSPFFNCFFFRGLFRPSFVLILDRVFFQDFYYHPQPSWEKFLVLSYSFWRVVLFFFALGRLFFLRSFTLIFFSGHFFTWRSTLPGSQASYCVLQSYSLTQQHFFLHVKIFCSLGILAASTHGAKKYRAIFQMKID